MFNYKHYTPIVRWKAAEKGALQSLTSEHKTSITPLVEFIMPQPNNMDGSKSPKELLQESIDTFSGTLLTVGDQVKKYWGQEPIFISVQLIDGSIRAEALEKILNQGKQLDIFMIPVIAVIPVIGFEADVNTRKVAVEFAKQSGHGLCLRVTDSHFKEESLPEDIQSFMNDNGLNPKDVDLLIDFIIIDDKVTYESLIEKINRIPSTQEWRTFTIAGGAFPRDLSHLEKHNQHTILRADWAIWNKLVENLDRAPSFADYTIQHPVYSSQSSMSNPSASIRYTLEDDWVIVRGEGLRNPKGAGFKQYPAQARLLADQKKVFKGENFSPGDAYIADKAKDINTKKTGNPKTWLEAGINHHLVLVVNQISNLP